MGRSASATTFVSWRKRGGRSILAALACAAAVSCGGGAVFTPGSPGGGGNIPGSRQGPGTPAEAAVLARGILDQLNFARTNPQGFAATLEALLPLYEGNLLRRPGEIAIRTVEGRAAVEEAIRVMRAQSPLPALSWSDGMARGALDHALDLGSKGAVGHVGSDGSSPSSRVNRYGQWVGSISENIAFGPRRALDIVQDLIIDDGIPDRGHRRNILDGAIRVAGSGCAAHTEYGTVCVIDHAAGYREGR